MQDETSRGELVLAPGEYIYIQDKQNGRIKTIVGGQQVSLSATDIPVLWNFDFKRYDRYIGKAPSAVQRTLVVPEGFYLVLLNPAIDDAKPNAETQNTTPALHIGKKVIIAGPDERTLWPGQHGVIVRGHRLRSNEFLVVEVYNDEEAKANWENAVIKETASVEPTEGDKTDKKESGKKETAQVTTIAPPELTLGQRIVIKGTDVSFYMPATGMKVIKTEGGVDYVEKAVTLERLEYCILVSEDGNKRYVKGPDVVFPEPTERFVKMNGKRKFRAIELNSNSAIHIKVIEDYTDVDDGKNHPAGEEMFIRGNKTPIYYPRKEHSVIRYGDDEEIHFAVAIPAGEARYVLNKDTGTVDRVNGPKMLMADPRNQVIVQRILSKEQTELWYPENTEALDFNAKLASLRAATGAEYVENLKTRDMDSSRMVARRMYSSASTEDSYFDADTKSKESAGRGFAGEAHTRKKTFTSPRSITLDTKFDGVPAVTPWVGFAVLKTKKDGSREVILGPQTALLDYDEVLQVLSLSTGKPKTTDNLSHTVYLRKNHNKIDDIIVGVETSDKVELQIKMSYRVNFEGETAEDQVKWFDVENYVKLLCDHVRSRIRNLAKKYTIEDFYGEAYDLIRDCILGNHIDGKNREGLFFVENNMRLYDVEILGLTIDDEEVDALLSKTQIQSVRDSLAIQNTEMNLERVKLEEAANRKILKERTESDLAARELTRQVEAVIHSITMEKLEAEKEQAVEKSLLLERAQGDYDLEAKASLARTQDLIDQRIAELKDKQNIETAAENAASQDRVKEASAVTPELIATLQSLGDNIALKGVAESCSPLAILGGKSLADVIGNIVNGTGLEGVAAALAGGADKKLKELL